MVLFDPQPHNHTTTQPHNHAHNHTTTQPQSQSPAVTALAPARAASTGFNPRVAFALGLGPQGPQGEVRRQHKFVPASNPTFGVCVCVCVCVFTCVCVRAWAWACVIFTRPHHLTVSDRPRCRVSSGRRLQAGVCARARAHVCACMYAATCLCVFSPPTVPKRSSSIRFTQNPNSTNFES